MKDAFGVDREISKAAYMPRNFIVRGAKAATPSVPKTPAERAKELWQAKQDARTPQVRNAWKAGRHIND